MISDIALDKENMKAYKNALVYVYGRGVERTDIVFDENIVSIGRGVGDACVEELPCDAVVVPGFIDEHIHGAGGADVMDGSEAALGTIADTVAKEGTTGFLATTMTQSPDNIENALNAVCAYRRTPRTTGADILGVHLEGPFVSASFAGAQPLEYIAAPNMSVFDSYNKASGNCIKIVTLAPEVQGANNLIKHLTSLGVVVSIGHSAAKYSDVCAAVEMGASNITHTFNAQSAVHHREIGVAGSALLIESLQCELICDGIHVSEPAMRLLVKSKPNGKVALITDAMRAKGLADGVSELGGQTVYIKNGEARLADGTLAGSVLAMNIAVRNLVEKVGMDFTSAVDCATITPAKTLGMANERGSIEVGKRADFAVLDGTFKVLRTVKQGETIFDCVRC